MTAWQSGKYTPLMLQLHCEVLNIDHLQEERPELHSLGCSKGCSSGNLCNRSGVLGSGGYGSQHTDTIGCMDDPS